MKLKEAIICDVRKEGVWDELHELLFKIPPLKRFKDEGQVPIDALDKMVDVFDQKYGIQLQYMFRAPQKTKTGSSLPYYTASLRRKDKNDWIGSVNGLTIYECLVKVVLLSYGEAKKSEKK